jgi:uncharacterized protein YhhL (DUF1145 family)
MLCVFFQAKILLCLGILVISFALLLLLERVLSKDVQINVTQTESVLMENVFALQAIQEMTVQK